MKALCNAPAFKWGLRVRGALLAADALLYLFLPSYVLETFYWGYIIDDAHRAMVRSLGFYHGMVALFLFHLSKLHPSVTILRLVFVYSVGHALLDTLQAMHHVIEYSAAATCFSMIFCMWSMYFVLTARAKTPRPVARRMPRHRVKAEAEEDVDAPDGDGEAEVEVIPADSGDVEVDVEGSESASDMEHASADEDEEEMEEAPDAPIVVSASSGSRRRAPRARASAASPIASRTRRRR